MKIKNEECWSAVNVNGLQLTNTNTQLEQEYTLCEIQCSATPKRVFKIVTWPQIQIQIMLRLSSEHLGRDVPSLSPPTSSPSLREGWSISLKNKSSRSKTSSSRLIPKRGFRGSASLLLSLPTLPVRFSGPFYLSLAWGGKG